MAPIMQSTLISCDEAGFTGNNMLNPEQPHFTYASHDLSLEESENLLRVVRKKYHTQMPELKANKLLHTANG